MHEGERILWFGSKIEYALIGALIQLVHNWKNMFSFSFFNRTKWEQRGQKGPKSHYNAKGKHARGTTGLCDSATAPVTEGKEREHSMPTKVFMVLT